MNKKGEINLGIGAIIVAFVAVIVGLALVNSIASNVGQVTTTNSVTNTTLAFPAAGSTVTLQGQAASSVIVINASNNAVVPASNYTILTYQLVNGALATQLQGNAGYFNGNNVNVSYTYEPLGYSTSSGARAVTAIIIIFLMLAIAAAALSPVGEMFRNKVGDIFGR